MRCSNTCLSNAQEAHKIAKIAMSARKRFDASTDQIPRIFYLYYGMIAVYVDPVQSCIENLRRGKSIEAPDLGRSHLYLSLTIRLDN